MRQALVAGWLAFVYLVLGASPAHFWLDSGEIGAASASLGVMHPPGVPGYTLLIRAVAAVPIGSLGFRMAVASALLGAGVVSGIFVLLARRKAPNVVAWGAVVWVLAGWTFVRQCRVVEIYAFAAALLIVVLLGFDPCAPARSRVGSRLVGVFAASWAAWCFGDLRLAFAPLIFGAWVVAIRRREPWALVAPLCVIAATATLMTLPLSSAAGPIADWGDPDTLGAAWDHLSARSIRESFADEILPASGAMWRLNAGLALDQLAADLGPPGLVMTGIGLVALWRTAWKSPQDRSVPLAMTWLLLVEAIYIVGINPMGIADRQTGLVVAPLAALVVAEALRQQVVGRPGRRWALAPLLWTILVVPAALQSAGDLATTRSWAPHSWSRAVLKQLPAGTLVLSQSDDLASGLLFARVIEGARPDVIAIPAQHLYKPAPQSARRDPRRSRIWQAASNESSEAGQITAAIAAHDGPVALERPATSIFASVRWWSDRGRLPLRITPSGSRPVRPAVEEEISDWLSRLPTATDRKRLAWAIAGDARGRARVENDLRGAVEALASSLQQVTGAHPSAWVTLGALWDRLGDPNQAIAATEQALRLEPGRPKALTNLALYWSRDPNTRDQAIVVARRAIALRPWRKDGWLRLAQLLDLAGDPQGAAAARARAEQAR